MPLFGVSIVWFVTRGQYAPALQRHATHLLPDRPRATLAPAAFTVLPAIPDLARVASP